MWNTNAVSLFFVQYQYRPGHLYSFVLNIIGQSCLALNLERTSASICRLQLQHSPLSSFALIPKNLSIVPIDFTCVLIDSFYSSIGALNSLMSLFS